MAAAVRALVAAHLRLPAQRAAARSDVDVVDRELARVESPDPARLAELVRASQPAILAGAAARWCQQPGGDGGADGEKGWPLRRLEAAIGDEAMNNVVRASSGRFLYFKEGGGCSDRAQRSPPAGAPQLSACMPQGARRLELPGTA